MSETQAFERMTRSQRDMAVAIAKDVIAQLKRDDGSAMEVVSGNGYIKGKLAEDATIAAEDDLSAHIDAIQANCKVCMLGACLLSKARLFDEVPLAAFLRYDRKSFLCGRDLVTEHLCTVFDDDTMFELEDAFEERRGGSDAERAIAIAENLIKNGGLFDVSEFDDEDDEDEEDGWDDEDEEDEDGDLDDDDEDPDDEE